MTPINDIPVLGMHAYKKLRSIYNASFQKEILQYRYVIEARMLSNQESPAAAMVHLFNVTESKIIKAWLLAAVWDITNPPVG